MNVVKRREYIKKKCLKDLVFKGVSKEIYFSSGHWHILHISHTNPLAGGTEHYDSLDDAVYDYVALEEVYGEDEL